MYFSLRLHTLTGVVAGNYYLIGARVDWVLPIVLFFSYVVVYSLVTYTRRGGGRALFTYMRGRGTGNVAGRLRPTKSLSRPKPQQGA